MSQAIMDRSPKERNGLNMEDLVNTVKAVKQDPSLADFEFRASNEWINGGENRSRIKEFYVAGTEDESREEAFRFTNGEPPVLLGKNEGANPVEFVLHALAGCITTTTVLHAAARGIDIERLSTELVGKIDVQGLLDLDQTVAIGYDSIDVTMDIEANCSDEELDELLAFAKEHSPVSSTIQRPVSVNLTRA